MAAPASANHIDRPRVIDATAGVGAGAVRATSAVAAAIAYLGGGAILDVIEW